jgi:hypothetical protein
MRLLRLHEQSNAAFDELGLPSLIAEVFLQAMAFNVGFAIRETLA